MKFLENSGKIPSCLQCAPKYLTTAIYFSSLIEQLDKLLYLRFPTIFFVHATFTRYFTAWPLMSRVPGRCSQPMSSMRD